MTVLKNLYTFMGLFALVFLFQNCGGVAFESQQAVSRGIASMDASTKMDCQFVGVDSLHYRLQDLLGIQGGDVSVLSDKGRPTSVMRIDKSKEDLGEADPAQGLLQNMSCGMTKYKISMEVFIDACMVGMSSAEGKSRLFPEGVENYDLIYLAFIGRLPTDYERGVLTALSAKLPQEKKAAGLCAAVAGSLESLVQI